MTYTLTRYRKMEVAAAVFAWALSSTCYLTPSNGLWGHCPQQADIAALQKRLSPGAQIFIPGSNEYDEATNRWSALNAPDFNLVVVPSVEKDVAETVHALRATTLFSSLLTTM